MAKIFVAFNIVSVDDIIIVVRENSNLAGIAWQSAVLHPPHTQRNFSVTNLQPVMHTVQVYSTPDGTTLGELKSQCEIDASITTVQSYRIVNFIVDRGNIDAPSFDPPSGQDEYNNPDLVGLEYVVFKAGYGPLIWDYHIQKLPDGGFKFIDGQIFANGEEYVLMVSNLTQTTQPASSTSGGYPIDVVDVPNNIIFGPAHYNKMLEVNGFGIMTIEIQDLTAIPNNIMFGVNTHRGQQKYVTVILPAGVFCLVNNKQRNKVHIGLAENVQFIKKGEFLRIVQWDGDYMRVGERIKGNSLTTPNVVPETGAWVVKAHYPRLYDWFVSELPAGEVRQVADDFVIPDADRAYWHYGDLKFWIPDAGGLFERNIGTADPAGVREGGNKQGYATGPHYHVFNFPPNSNSDAGFGKIATGNAPPEGTIPPANTTLNTDITTVGGASETRPINVARYSHIII